MQENFTGYVDEVLAPAVERGAELLDRREPGWRDRISPGDLKMASCEACVVGQLCGQYAQGLNQLGISYMGANYGFDLLNDQLHIYGIGGTQEDRDQLFLALENLWLGVIKGE